jgi:hypothetical protein
MDLSQIKTTLLDHLKQFDIEHHVCHSRASMI